MLSPVAADRLRAEDYTQSREASCRETGEDQLKKWFRHHLCRLFKLTPNEDIPSSIPFSLPPTGWDDLWESKDAVIVWPRMVKSDAWARDIEPFFKKSLLATFFAITRETGATDDSRERLRRLQERAVLINEWLEQPRIAMMMDEMAFENAMRSGNRHKFDAEKERANAGRRDQ